MKKKLFITSGMFAIAVLFIFNNRQNKTHQAEAKEKRKVLILHILEENWDNLEFVPGKHKGKSFKMTKKAWIKKEGMDREYTKEFILEKKLPSSLEKGYAPSDLRLFVFHIVRYFGKTGELKDNDPVSKGEIRFKEYWYSYGFVQIPKVISLLTQPSMWQGDGTDPIIIPPTSFKCEHIRLVEDLHIASHDSVGNLKITYGGKPFNLKVNHKLSFPAHKIVITKHEIKKFTKKIQGKIKDKFGVESDIRGCNPDSIVTKGSVYFKTKVTVTNFGYTEI